MNGKFLTAILLVLLLVSFSAPSWAAFGGKIDTIGLQFVSDSAAFLSRHTTAGFTGLGKLFRTKGVNSALATGDSGEVAGDSSSHFFEISIDNAINGGNGKVDTIWLTLPLGMHARSGVDTIYARSALTGGSIGAMSVFIRPGATLAQRDIIGIKSATASTATGGKLFLGLKGIVNDTTLYPVDTSIRDTVIGGRTYWVDTIGVLANDDASGLDKTSQPPVHVLLRAATSSQLGFIQNTGTISTTEAGIAVGTSRTAYTSLQADEAANIGATGELLVGLLDRYGNLNNADTTSRTVSLQVWGGTGANPPSGAGRIRQASTLGGSASLFASISAAHKDSGAVFRFVAYTRSGSVYFRASCSGLPDATSGTFTVVPTVTQTVTLVTTETPPHTSPDTMTVGQTKQFQITLSDSFSNGVANDSILIRNVMGGTMFSASPFFWDKATSPGTFDQTTASRNPDTAQANASGQFVFSYTASGAVGTDTLIVTPYNQIAQAKTLLNTTGRSLETRYVIRVSAGPVAQVTITPITTNLNVHSANTRSAGRYINKQTIHPDSTFFYGAVIAGDTVVVRVVLKDASGNIRNFVSSDLAQVSFNTTGRKGTVLTGSVLDTVSIGGTNYVLGKFYYRSKTNPLDRDSIRITYASGASSFTSTYTEFQTVGGPPATAVLMAPDSLTGTTSVAADTMQVADSLLIQALVYDRYGNFADSGKSVVWSILDRPTGGKDGFNRLYSTQASGSYPDPTDSTNTIGKRAGTVDTIYHFTKWRQAGSGTVGAGSYSFDSTMIQNAFYTDSAAGLSKIVVRYNVTGGLTLDTILIYKQPKPITKIDLTTGRTTTYSTSTTDTTISSGQTVYFFTTLMDVYGNVITPDTSTGQGTAGTTTKRWPKAQRIYRSSIAGTGASVSYTTDGIFANAQLSGAPKTTDSLRFVSRGNAAKGADSLLTIGTTGTVGATPGDTAVIQTGTPHIRLKTVTLGTRAGWDWIVAYYTKGNTAQTSTATTTGAFDSVRIKTTLPLTLYTFKIALSTTGTPGDNDSTGVKAGVAGQPVRVRLTPRDSSGADIYTFKYRYLKLEVISLKTGSITDTLKAAFQKVGRKLQGIYWTAATTSDEALIDSTGGSAYAAKGGGATQTDSTFTDNVEDFWFYPSLVDSYAVRVTALPFDTSKKTYVVKRSDSTLYAGKATVKISHTVIDTVVLTSSQRTGLGYAQNTPFDLNIALKDSFLNAVDDTAYVVNVTSNSNEVNGIDNRIVVQDSKSIRIEPTNTMSGLSFYAEVSQDIFGNSFTTKRGNLAGGSAVTVSTASINAPAVLKGRDFPNDRGGWILLTFPPSANHPNNPNSTIDDNLPIDYYAVYRSLTSSLTNAVQWEILPAVPLPSGLDSIRAAISMHGDTSSYAYYWVAAVKGALPPGVIAASQSLPKDAGIKLPENVVMGIPVTQEMQMSAVGVSAVQAVVGAQGSIISPVTNNVKVRSLDNTLPVGVFRPGATSIQLEDILVVASVFGDKKNYDPIYDIVKDGVVDIEDLFWQVKHLGSTGKEGKEGTLINDGVNLGAALALNTASENTGSIFNIGVTIDKVKEVAGYRFTVVYDPKNYEFVEAVEGAFLGSKQGKPLFVKNDEVKGEITVVGLLTGSDLEKAPDGNGILANVKFDWISDTMSEITVERIQLIDRNGLVNELKPVKLERPIALPTEYALEQNYPNPFNPETRIKFSLPEAARVSLTIYNILGQKVKTLVNENMKAGFQMKVWNGTNDLGVKVASGVYIYQIKAGKFVAQKKMVFMK